MGLNVFWQIFKYFPFFEVRSLCYLFTDTADRKSEDWGPPTQQTLKIFISAPDDIRIVLISHNVVLWGGGGARGII
jgi:hypothetical protein